jgi:hypothetical protein
MFDDIEKIMPKGVDNPFGSITGPYNTISGWGKPAQKGIDRCPKCGGLDFHYEPGFAEAAWNKCPCGYEEFFLF